MTKEQPVLWHEDFKKFVDENSRSGWLDLLGGISGVEILRQFISQQRKEERERIVDSISKSVRDTDLEKWTEILPMLQATLTEPS